MTPLQPHPAPLAPDVCAGIDAWWRAANFLAVGQIYLLDNPLLKAMAAALDACVERIQAVQRAAREDGAADRARWPMIVLASPKGWTGPKEIEGKRIEGTFRAHQVPLPDPRGNPDHLRLLEDWLRSYRPQELFHPDGGLREEIAALAPAGARRVGENPHANGGLLLRALHMPDFRAYAVDVPRPGTRGIGDTHVLGRFTRDVIALNEPTRDFRLFGPDETQAAVQILRQQLPAVKLRVINVVDLCRLMPHSEHPHGLADRDFDERFTTDKPVIFAFHAYPWPIHRLTAADRRTRSFGQADTAGEARRAQAVHRRQRTGSSRDPQLGMEPLK